VKSRSTPPAKVTSVKTAIILECLTSPKQLDTEAQTGPYAELERIQSPIRSVDQPSQVGWNTRDLLLYAVGIGAKHDDLPLAFGGQE
jgi:hypothetical protein